MSEKKSCCSGCLGKFLIAVLVLLAIVILGFNGMMNRANTDNKSNPTILERKATIKDIELEESYKFPVSIKLTVTPNVDIRDLELQLEFYNSSGETVSTKYIELGNVSSVNHYEETISVLDLDISAISSERCAWSVSRGTVKLLS